MVEWAVVAGVAQVVERTPRCSESATTRHYPLAASLGTWHLALSTASYFSLDPGFTTGSPCAQSGHASGGYVGSVICNNV